MDVPLLMMLGRMAPALVGDLTNAIGTERFVVVQRLYKLTSIDVVAQMYSVVSSGRAEKWDFRAHVHDLTIGELPDNLEVATRLIRNEMMRQLNEAGATQVSIADELGVSHRTVMRGIARVRALKPPVPLISDPTPGVEVDANIRLKLTTN